MVVTPIQRIDQGGGGGGARRPIFPFFERNSHAIKQGGANTVKVNLSLKDSQVMIIESLKEKHSIDSSEEIVSRCVTSALSHGDLESIFGTPREQCGAGCFDAEPRFEINVEDADYESLGRIYEDYVFQPYVTKDEEISKTIRCVLNFVEEEPDSILI